MEICEFYHSRQGEGLLTGTPSIFLRTSGCNLRCGFCDTPFASWQPEGETVAIAELSQRILLDPISHVVITGGEPMVWNSIQNLTETLVQGGKHVTIETAGTIDRPVACNLMSISPKLSNSDPDPLRAGRWLDRHQKRRQKALQVVPQLIARYPYQLKFVVATKEDLEEATRFLELVAPWDADRVLWMPEGIDQKTLDQRTEWLEPWCRRHGFRFCPRKHIEWYGNRRGT
jgi:7-carboxy-7-deazaguanine synthase